MMIASVVGTLEAIAEDPSYARDTNGVQALLTAATIIRSLPEPLVACMDILLNLEDARPKP